DGEWVPAASGETFNVYNPSTGEVLAEVAKAGVEDARRAIDAANAAKDRIAKMSAYDRSEMLRKVAAQVDEASEEVARLIAMEAGKPINDARYEVRRASITLTSAAEEAKRIHGETYQADAFPVPPGNEDRILFSVREPVGVVAAISPFNFPLNLLLHKVAPALAAGNAVVAKPTSETPLVALRLGEFLEKAGAPAGAINVVAGPGDTVGRELVENPGTDLISFTGSTAIGTGIATAAGKYAKRVILEMGGMDPLIVLDDADVPKAAAAAARATCSMAGQICTAVKRVFAEESVEEEFSRRYTEEVSRFQLGPALEEKTDVGPVISESTLDRAQQLVEQAVDGGATVTLGGKRAEEARLKGGYFWEPTVLVEVGPEMAVMQDEPFAPLGPVHRVADEDEAIALANGTRYGLQAAVYSRDIGRALRVARELKAGGVMINDPTSIRWDNLPFGGIKMSGLGREGAKYAIEEMTETK
ncbi:MAG: aldehyde dehydrogenase family protein, partial [Thermoplasmata archaeon]|nr:aldehyde dehydrogenase family protein [Thermoplasmata archaeon]